MSPLPHNRMAALFVVKFADEAARNSQLIDFQGIMKTVLANFAGECAAVNTALIDKDGNMMIVVVLPDIRTLDEVTAALQKME